MVIAGPSRHGSAWVKIGLSVRIAQDLRLMMDVNDTLSFADQEECRRTFWSVYLLDRLVSCGRARPPAILDACCQLQLPCKDAIWRAGQWEQTPTLDQISSRQLFYGSQQGSFAMVVLMSYVLSRCAQYMLQWYNIRTRDPPWDPSSDWSSIHSDLIFLERGLDPGRPMTDLISRGFSENGWIDQPQAGPVIFAHALFHLCHCLLNHPFLLRRRLDSCGTKAPSSFLARAFDTGRDYSKRLIRLLCDARDCGFIVATSFYGYCAILAGTVQALHMHNNLESVQLESAENLRLSISFLKDVGQYWKNVSLMVCQHVPFSDTPSCFSSH
jgi:hypothetical protein